MEVVVLLRAADAERQVVRAVDGASNGHDASLSSRAAELASLGWCVRKYLSLRADRPGLRQPRRGRRPPAWTVPGGPPARPPPLGDHRAAAAPAGARRP